MFGLLGLLAYKLARDGTATAARCTQTIESYRIRYEDAMLRGGEVAFSYTSAPECFCSISDGLDCSTASSEMPSVFLRFRC